MPVFSDDEADVGVLDVAPQVLVAARVVEADDRPPDSAAPPKAKRYSGTLSSSTPTWKGRPSTRRDEEQVAPNADSERNSARVQVRSPKRRAAGRPGRGRCRCAAAARPRWPPAVRRCLARGSNVRPPPAKLPDVDVRSGNVAAVPKAAAKTKKTPSRRHPCERARAAGPRAAHRAQVARRRHRRLRIEGLLPGARRRHREGGEDLARHLLSVLRQQGRPVPRARPRRDRGDRRAGRVARPAHARRRELRDAARVARPVRRDPSALRPGDQGVDRGRDRQQRVRLAWAPACSATS